MITTAETAFVEQEIFSTFILRNLATGILPEIFFRNVSDFDSGDTLNIPTIGAVTLQEVTEDEDVTYNPIDTGRVTLTVTEEVGDAYYITDNMREDGYNIPALLSARAEEGMIAWKEHVQTDAFAALEAAQTVANPNTINSFAHRFVGGGGTNQVMTLADFSDMALAFDKANVPAEGRIAIVDPVVATTIEQGFQGTFNVDSNPTTQAVLEEGMAEGMQFRFHIFGWNVFVSNLLPDIAAGTDVDGTTDSTRAGKANLFFSIASDNITPLMGVFRRMPTVESERNKDKRRNEHTWSARWGFGAQRVDSLGVIVTDAAFTVDNT